MATPQLRIYIAVSLDGFIATVDGGVEWLERFQAFDFGYESFVAEIDAIVMGRTTYEQVRTFGEWPYPGKSTIVMSSKQIEGLPDNTRVSTRDAEELASGLRAAGGDVWILGGARTIRGFLDAGAIDRFEIFVMPVLLGDGLPLFGRSIVQAPLQLIDTHQYSNDVLKLTYRFRRHSASGEHYT